MMQRYFECETHQPNIDLIPFLFQIAVLNRDGSRVSVDDSNKKIKIIQERRFCDVDGAKEIVEEFDLNENAEVTVKIETTRRDASFLLKAQYMEQTVDLGMFYIDSPEVVDRIGLDVKIISTR